MGRASRLLLLCLLLVAVAAVPVEGKELRPSLSNKDFIIYDSNIAGEYTRQVFPFTFTITYSGDETHTLKEWWDPLEDPEDYSYDIVSKTYSFVDKPPQVIEFNGARILLSYFASLSVVAMAGHTWWGQFWEKAKVYLTVTIYGRIDVAPSGAMFLDLDREMAKLVGRDDIRVRYEATVKRLTPAERTWTISGEFRLVLDDLDLFFYRLYAQSISVSGRPGDMAVFGSFEETGFIGVAPKVDIGVTLCLDGVEGYTMTGIVYYRNRFGEVSRELTLTSAPGGRCSYTVLEGVPMIPGRYQSPNGIVVYYKTGALSVGFMADATVEGVMATASTPLVIIWQRPDGRWMGKVIVGTSYKSYNDDTPAAVGVSEVVFYMPGQIIRVPYYGGKVFTEPTIFEAEVTFDAPGISMEDVKEGVPADVTVWLKVGGTRISSTARVTATVMTPVSTAGLVVYIYHKAIMLGFLMLLAGAFLVFLNAVYQVFSGSPSPLLSTERVHSVVLGGTLVTGILLVFPYLYSIPISLMSMAPEVASYLQRTPLSDGLAVLRMRGDEIIAAVYTIYDSVINSMITDYNLWVESSIGGKLLSYLVGLGMLITLGFSIALLGKATLNSIVGGVIVSPLGGLLLTALSALIMLLPTVGMVRAFIFVASFIVALAPVVMLIALVLGAVLLLMPLSPTLNRIGEDMVGAAVLFFLTIPIFAPIVYTVYHYVKDYLDWAIVEAQAAIPSIPILSIDLILPVEPLMRVAAYIAMTGIASGLIVVAHAFVLTRTWLIAGLGEAIGRIFRR